jgi:hypothetical protein
VISQAATFIGVCEGFLGIPVNWDLWVHLFRAELHPLTTVETRVRRAVRAGGLSISLWNSRREFYLPCTMTSNNAEWERGVVLPSQQRCWPPPYTGKVLKEKTDSWHHGVSPSPRQERLESLLNALKGLADAGLGAAWVLANFHHRLLTVDYRIEVHMDLQAEKSPVVVKGPFFPRVVNPRFRICGTMCNARIQSSKARKAIY